MKASRKQQWVIIHLPLTTLLAKEPRKCRGGYMDSFGSRYIGKEVRAMPLLEFEKEYGTRFGEYYGNV